MSDEIDAAQAQYDGTLGAERGPIHPVLRYDGGDEPWAIVSGNQVLATYATKDDALRVMAEVDDEMAEVTAERAETARSLTGAATPDEHPNEE